MSVRFPEKKLTNQIQRNLFVSQPGEIALNKKWESYPQDDSHHKSNYNLLNKKYRLFFDHFFKTGPAISNGTKSHHS